MGYLRFPSGLTEEELMLQAKYAKLRGKKKAVRDLKMSNAQSVQKSKASSDARDAREVAKKLITSGVIAAIKTPKRPEESFKRPRGMERKLNATEKIVSSYQPYSAARAEEKETPAKRPKLKELYDNFVLSTDSAEKIAEKPVSEAKEKEQKPPKGNTIFVYGYKLSDDFLKEHFSTFGKIIQIRIESDRKGFVTFEKSDSAAQAIMKMHGVRVSSCELQVSMARRQFVFDNSMIENSVSDTWKAVASRDSRKGPIQTAKRDLKTYDDDIFA